jgi:hypothetical protein
VGRSPRTRQSPSVHEVRARPGLPLTFNFFCMEQLESPHLQRLIELADEAEEILSRNVSSHDIRHGCAVARGYLDLARSYNEPVNIEDVERVVLRMRELFLQQRMD